MKSKVEVTICGSNLTILSEDSQDYVFRIARIVNDAMSAILAGNPSLSVTSSALLAALNFADETAKIRDNTENLRAQVKTYLEEAGKLKIENDELRREAARLTNELRRIRAELQSDPAQMTL